MAKKKIYDRLKKKGLKVETLARHAGMSRPLLTYYFENDHLITGTVAKKIHRAIINVTVDAQKLANEFKAQFIA